MLKFSSQTARKIARFFTVAAMGVFLAAACVVGADAVIETSLEANFQLHVGETAVVLPENIQVSLLAVSSDSRCGKGETCIWEGDAALRIRVRVNGEESGEYELHTSEREASVAGFGAYHIRLIALLPPAISGRAIPAEQYVAVLTVGRGFAGNNGIE